MANTISRFLRYTATIGLLAAGYAASAKAGLVFAIPPGNATAVWPSAGLAVAALLLLRCRVWPGVWLGSALANFTTDLSCTASCVIATGNTLEAILACWLIRRLLNIRTPFSHVHDSFVFAAVAAGSSVVAASVGAAMLRIAGLVDWLQFTRNWWTWWLGDVASLMIVVPLVLASHQRRWITPTVARWAEFALLLACVAVAGPCIFGAWLPERLAEGLAYLTVVLLIWVTLRFDLFEIASATLLLYLAAIWGISRGVGAYRTEDSLFDLQVFMNVYALTGLALAGVVTQRREAASAAQTSQEQLESEIVERERTQKWFRRLLESTPDATIVTGGDGVIVLVNAAAEKLFGYPSGGLVGLSIEVLVPDCQRQQHVEHRRRYNSAPHMRLMGGGLELSAQRRDGLVFPVEIALGPLPTDEGLFVFSSIRDITERKAAQRALQESQERFDLAVRGTDAGIWDWDLRTNAVYFSARWKSLLGYEDHEIPADFAEWERRLHPDDRQRALETIRQYLDGERTDFELEHRLQHKDGTYRWLLARGAAVRDPQGRVYRMVGSHLDITDRKLGEERLRKQEVQLLVAAEIQQQLLPHEPPKLPGFDVAGRCYPAEFAAGDHFDFLWLPDGSLLLVLADVSGHGVGPAIVTASLHARFHSLSELSSDLPQMLKTLNARLFRETAGEMFITLIAARIDPQSRTLTCVNAGHPSGCVLAADGAVKAEFSSASPPLALLPDVEFAASSPVRLADGDLLFLFTDGLTEAHRPQGSMWGTAPAIQIVCENRDKTASEIIDALYGGVREYLGPDKPHDDITLLVVKVGPEP